MAAKRASDRAKSPGVFGQARKPSKMFRAGLYARVSTNDQQTATSLCRFAPCGITPSAGVG